MENGELKMEKGNGKLKIENKLNEKIITYYFFCHFCFNRNFGSGFWQKQCILDV
jgi:hypothetical protein